MKYIFCSLLLFLSIWVLTGCLKKTPVSDRKPDPLERRCLDSIHQLDSLVNATKANKHARAFFYAKQALSLGMKTNYPAVLARAYMLMGIVYSNTRNDSSYFFYSEAIKIAEKFNLSGIKPILFFNFSNLYSVSSDYKMTTVLLDSALQFAVKEKDYVDLSNIYNSLGGLKFDLHDNEGAKVMFDSSYKIAEKHNLFRQMGKSLGNLALFEPDTNKYLEIQRQALKFLDKTIGTEEARATILINIGLQFSNPDSSIKYYQSAINTIDSGGSNEVRMGVLNNMANCFLSKNNFRKAEACLIGEAIPIARSENNYDWMSTLYDSYADVLKSEKKIDSALAFEKEALKKREEADKKQASDQIRLLGMLLDVKNKELKIETYRKEIEQKETRIQQMKFWFVSFLLVAGSIAFIGFWIIQRKKLRLQKQLVFSAKRIIDADENLKGRLAMELHDMISPLYTQILKQIESTEIGDDRIKDELHSKLTGLADHLRQISHRLSKVFIQQLSFAELAKGVCDDMQYLTDVPIKLELSLDSIDLTSEMATHLVRIIQELLANAVKYVDKGVIKLNISIEFTSLYILYQDDGPGFDPKKLKQEGLGLLNIIERAKIIGGKSTLESSPGNGTKWRIFIPLK